jgi:hypothetical protein
MDRYRRLGFDVGVDRIGIRQNAVQPGEALITTFYWQLTGGEC